MIKKQLLQKKTEIKCTKLHFESPLSVRLAGINKDDVYTFGEVNILDLLEKDELFKDRIWMTGEDSEELKEAASAVVTSPNNNAESVASDLLNLIKQELDTLQFLFILNKYESSEKKI